MSDLFNKHHAGILAAHRSLYDEMARSHPSLMQGRVYCARCGRVRTVDAAKCLRDGWPKCCSGTMVLKDQQQ